MKESSVVIGKCTIEAMTFNIFHVFQINLVSIFPLLRFIHHLFDPKPVSNPPLVYCFCVALEKFDRKLWQFADVTLPEFIMCRFDKGILRVPVFKDHGLSSEAGNGING